MQSNSGNNTAIAMVVVKNPVPVRFALPQENNGRVEFTLLGDPGFAYALQRSTTLSSWETVVTNVMGADGTIRFTNAISTGPEEQFYRAKLVP